MQIVTQVSPPPLRLPAKVRRLRGFSLVELVVVIMITGIIASVIGTFIAGPVAGFFDQARRSELVDAGQLALLRMSRDLRAALPNSVRISGGALELLLTLDGDRYRTEPPGVADDRLAFNAADDRFNTFRRLGAGQVVPAGSRLAIYPLGAGSGADPYNNGVMTPSGMTFQLNNTSTVNGTTEYRVELSAPYLFPQASPNHRIFLVRGPVSWRCAGGDLLRYDGYAVTGAQAVPPVGGSSAVVVKDLVQSCTFRYAAGTAQRNAVALLTLELADPAKTAEVVRLVRQVHINNVP